MTQMYSKKVMQHFQNPKNVGEIKNADAKSTVGNPICGDTMSLYLKVKDNKITDIKFRTFGCAAAIATSSILTQIVKGKTLNEAMKITKDHVIKELGGLPPQKIHCSMLIVQALQKAIKNYKKKN